MNNVQAIIFGALQGISEFLPISSSGHLQLLDKLWPIHTNPLFFDISLHLGTLLALLIVFRKDLWLLLKHPKDPLWLWLLAGTIPTVAIALIFKPWIEQAFQTGKTLGIEFIMTGILLLFSEIRAKEHKLRKALGFWPAVLIGCAQGAAILPALSRSGLTMAAAIGLGLERKEAVRFSFLLSIPAILGATILMGKDFVQSPVALDHGWLWALLASAGFGYLSIRFLLSFVSRHSIKPFGYYTMALGILIIIGEWWLR